ncbi:hypothetical protein DPMN_170520 [Dreissena polymorpha]|uniref:Uncharacterized protein n=1 Tax=Dreissena polymorpha TaxID=45954 RepID=A0A9D4DYR6_DREPO|nr:hypothetical protein DPMN_170520 [Dreissena polymorpha]
MSEACWSTVAQIILANQNTDLESGERIGYSEEHVWCSSDVRVLIAGDSNVHRLKSACPPNARIDFLPVSGAKYVSDRKGFRKLLHQELMSGCYDILYLHLGSNDVCCKDSNFYRLCTEIHVVLCVILPRDFDVRMFPRWPLSGAQLRNYCQWIRSANSMLWELSHHVPSVRYMDYAATKQKSLYLSHDGLHLSAEGARRCLASIHDDLPNQLCVEAAVQDPTEWPALSATEVPVQEHDSTIALFSDIVQTGAQPEIQDKVDASEVPVPRDIKPQTHKITEDEINVPSNIHCHRDTEETPQQDDNAANEDKVNVPSHFFFQRDTDETPQQDMK